MIGGMISVQGLAKPQYLLRPSQIVKRLLREVHAGTVQKLVRLPWGLPLEVATSDTVGLAIANQGLYDIVTTEVLWRLTAPGDHTLDVGANIGYMTSIFALRSGRSGRVDAFEPHPEVFGTLQRNADRWRDGNRCAPVIAHKLALSKSDGSANLDFQPGEENNTSFAFLSATPSKAGITVETRRLCHLLEGAPIIGVLKIDAQWHEAAVLEGAGDHLRSGKIRDIVFEEEAPYPAESHRILQDAGYAIFWFEEHFIGPKMIPPDWPCKRRSYDILPSYLATKDPKRAERLLSVRGWQSF